MAEPIVFVIGAGASVPYGLPTGNQLREDICKKKILPTKLGADPEDDLRAIESEYQRFQKVFLMSRRYSIDRFLQNRSEFADFGKQAICYHINQAETQMEKYPMDCWISSVFNRLMANYGPGINRWPVKFVIFNYDRILEYFLSEMYANSTDCTFGDAYREISNNLGIVHVYGKIPDDPNLFQATQSSMNFGMGGTPLSRMAEGIQVLGEERGGSWSNGLHTEADRVMRSASTVIFLGFSFDPVNCSAIGLGGNHGLKVNGAGWYSSGYGLQTRERDDACKLTSPLMKFGSDRMSCLEFLREYVSI